MERTQTVGNETDIVSSPTVPTNLAELDRPALEAAFAERGLERFRARQVFRWIYGRGVSAFGDMTDLPQDNTYDVFRCIAEVSPDPDAGGGTRCGTQCFGTDVFLD